MKTKMEKKEETIQVHKSVYSAPIYEMEVFTKFRNVEYTDESYEMELETENCMHCHLYSHGVGYYPTKERALEHYDLITEDPWEYEDVVAMQIRMKPMICLLEKDQYIKEWTYVCGLIEDESIVRNYDEEYYRFEGRSAEMIHHKVGDVVWAYYNGNWIWGVVAGVPPTPDRVDRINNRMLEHIKDPESAIGSFLDWTDDSYTILTRDNDEDHVHVPAHCVIKPVDPVPEFVEKTLILHP